MFELAEHFIQGHETHLLTTNYDFKIPNLVVHKKPILKGPYTLQFLSNVYHNTKRTTKIINNHNIDLVGSNGAET
jgi:hypothetical protein